MIGLRGATHRLEGHPIAPCLSPVQRTDDKAIFPCLRSEIEKALVSSRQGIDLEEGFAFGSPEGNRNIDLRLLDGEVQELSGFGVDLEGLMGLLGLARELTADWLTPPEATPLAGPSRLRLGSLCHHNKGAEHLGWPE